MRHAKINDGAGTGTTGAIGFVLQYGTKDGTDYVQIEVNGRGVWVPLANVSEAVFNHETNEFDVHEQS